jgi:hypothetical protein
MLMLALAVGTLAICFVLGRARSVADLRAMARDLSSSMTKPRPKPLSIGRVMAAVAGLALAFAFLPTFASITFAVTVLGILVVDGLHPRLVTAKGGVWAWFPWVVWFFALVACPVAIAVIGVVYEHTGPPAFSGPRPWAAGVVDGLAFAHIAVSVIAAVGVAVLTRGGFRWVAWLVISVIGTAAFVVWLGAKMSTTGVYL